MSAWVRTPGMPTPPEEVGGRNTLWAGGEGMAPNRPP